MSAYQRNKGAAYEREVASEINKFFGWEPVENGDRTEMLPQTLRRKLGQARDSGNDLDLPHDRPVFTLELKRRKTLGTVMGWMRQALAAVGPSGRIPAVVAREDQGASIVIMYLDDFLTVATPYLEQR